MALDLGELVAKLRVDGKQFDRGIKDGEHKFQALAGRIASIATAAGLAAGALLGVALVGAMNEQDVAAKMAANLDLTVEQAGKVGHMAGTVYSQNFGESLADVGDAMTKVTRATELLGDGTNETIERITSKALVLRDVFGQDMVKAISAAQQAVRNGLAKDGDEAFDLIAHGVQVGIDKSEDLLDTLNEYSTQFRALGISGPEALGLIGQAIQAGARDSDTAADALKEFAIRSKDASAASAAGFKRIGLDAKAMTKIFSVGGPQAARALDDVLDRLRAMKDPVQRDLAAVELFGTKAEDLQQSLFAMDLTTAARSFGEFGGAVQKASDTVGATASSNIASFKRQLEMTFVETLGGKVIPAVTEAARWLSTNFGPALKATAGFIKENQEWLGPLAVTLGVFVGIVTAITLAMKIWTAVTAIYTTVQWALNLAMMANPIGLIIIAIVALVAGLIFAYKHSEAFRKVVDGAFKSVATAAKWLWETVLKPTFNAVVGTFKAVGAVATWLWRNAIGPAFAFIAKVAGMVGQNVRSFGALFFWLGQTAVMPTIGAIIAVVKVLAAVFSWLWSVAISPVIDGLAIAVRWVAGIIAGAFGIVMTIVGKVGEVWRSVFGRIAGIVSEAFGAAVSFVKGGINGVIGLVNTAVGFINRNLIGNLNKIPGVNFTTIPALPKLARGGKVAPTPGGRPVMMGDGGQVEYGVPHRDMERIIGSAVAAGSGTGDGSTITIVVTDEMRRVRKKARIQGGRRANRTSTVLVGG